MLKTEGQSKASLLSFVGNACSFDEIQRLLSYESEKPAARAASEDDQLVGFGILTESTWRELWESKADGYAAFIQFFRDSDVKTAAVPEEERVSLCLLSTNSCPKRT